MPELQFAEPAKLTQAGVSRRTCANGVASAFALRPEAPTKLCCLPRIQASTSLLGTRAFDRNERDPRYRLYGLNSCDPPLCSDLLVKVDCLRVTGSSAKHVLAGLPIYWARLQRPLAQIPQGFHNVYLAGTRACNACYSTSHCQRDDANCCRRYPKRKATRVSLPTMPTRMNSASRAENVRYITMEMSLHPGCRALLKQLLFPDLSFPITKSSP